MSQLRALWSQSLRVDVASDERLLVLQLIGPLKVGFEQCSSTPLSPPTPQQFRFGATWILRLWGRCQRVSAIHKKAS